MKHCPKCGNSYTDDTLRFCLEDGTPLADGDEQATVVRPGERESYKTEKLPSNMTVPQHEALRVDIPSDNRTTPITVQTGKSHFPWAKFVIAVLVVGFIVVLGAGLLGVAFYVGSGKNVAVAHTATPTPTFTPATPPDKDKQKLEEEVANLKKKLEEAGNSNSDTDSPSDPDLSDIGGTARVNSPNDGFLALRNLPSSEIGQRIAKIPHGATINILACTDQAENIAGRKGHWCMVSYNSQVGWVFDVWIIKNS
ncbi:MAG: hypothetical protein DMF62_15850 [Acidobacteria bacterium]|nr:MAG: hypothetical protein DMF62_15850 [Acidobacteriota bacterium]